MSARDPERGGPLAWFARNHVAANLVFGFFVVAGLASLARLQLEVFPEVTPRQVLVQVPYPGAPPQEVEDGILLRVEEALADVEGVEELRGSAQQGLGVVTAELHTWADRREVLDDVKAAVDRIQELPPEAEEPVVTDPPDRREVLTVAVHGDVSRALLDELAQELERELVATGEVSTVDVEGVPPKEVSIELDPAALRRFGLSFDEVAAAVRGASLDLPAGTLEGERVETLVRTTGQAYHADAFGELVLRASDEGALVRLRDVARIRDTFRDDAYAVWFDGRPAVLLRVYRIGREGALAVRGAVEDVLERSRAHLPPGVGTTLYDDRTEPLESRIRLLLENAGLGLLLVLVVLGLTLDARLAAWIAAGLCMAFLGTLALLPLVDVSIHMLSLFGFILVLGLVVDDAIVVGENVHRLHEEGLPWPRAAVQGVREVASPVLLVVLSTIVVFLPLVAVQGEVGQIIRSIPLVVAGVLVLSLVESLLVLPSHLSRGEERERPGRVRRFLDRQRARVGGALDRFARGAYPGLVRRAIRWRYAALALTAALAAVTVALVPGGFVGWSFLPDVNANRVIARLAMPPGTSGPEVRRQVERLAEAGRALARELEEEADGAAVVQHVQAAIGGQPFSQGGGATAGTAVRSTRLGEAVLVLSDADGRAVGAEEVADRWRDAVGAIPGARSLAFEASLFTAGAPIFVRLAHPHAGELRAAAAALRDELARVEGVRELTDSLVEGQPQLRITGLTPAGHALGFTPREVARQVRAAVYGLEAQRVQRGRDEVRVYVRWPDTAARGLADVEELLLRRPAADGGRPVEVPLRAVARYELSDGVSELTRARRERVIEVTATVDDDVVRAGQVNGLLTSEVLPALVERHPGLTWSLEGESEAQSEALSSLAFGFALSLAAVYALMAGQFRSYAQPLLVMAAIPLGLVGSIWGHVLVGLFRDMPLSFMSMFGVVALAGVVVNDALILIDLANRLRGTTPRLDVVVEAASRRCRPIVLTTVTTFLALTPMILETSLQAQFLVPVAVALGFGVLFASTVTLLVVPVGYVVLDDIAVLLGRRS